VTGHELLLNIAGGVALLLWATRMVRTGILRAYGSELRRILARSTRNRARTFLMGLGIAGLLQSSTATALLTVSFAGRGLIATAAGLAIMLGADVGSTLVVQVLSFDLAWLSPALIVLGVTAFLSTSLQIWRHLGRVSIGLGLMLLSLSLIVGSSQAMRESDGLSTILLSLAGEPIIAVLLAAFVTWLAHSSVAIVLLVMSLVTVGVVTPVLGFLLVLGANVGSGVVPLVLSVSHSPTARRVPLGNLLFRASGALVAIPLVSLVAPYIAAIDADPARQVANFHTGFNLALALICLPLVSWMAQFCEKVFREAPQTDDQPKPKYLDEAVLDQPSAALACATREVMRMAEVVEGMLSEVMEIFENNDSKLLSRVSKSDDSVDELHEAIKLYLSKISRNALDEESSAKSVELITFTTNLEHIGDIIDRNLLELAQKKIKQKLSFSAAGWEELCDMHTRVMGQMQLAMSVFVSGDVHLARQLLRSKETLREMGLAGSEAHLQRLRSGNVDSIESSALHLDMLRDLKRINSHLTSVAYPILDAEGELRQSRLKASTETCMPHKVAQEKADSKDQSRKRIGGASAVAKQ